MTTFLPTLVLPVLLQAAPAGHPSEPASGPPTLVCVGALPTGIEGGGIEIVSVQQAVARAAVCSAQIGAVEVFDLASPAAPRSLGVRSLGLAAGEELTSVALHPNGTLVACAVRAAGPLAPGRVVLLDLGGAKAEVPAGIQPDCVAFSPDGGVLLVANEAEAFVAAEGSDDWRSGDGSLTKITLGSGPDPAEGARAETIELPAPVTAEGAVRREHRRTMEREVGGETVDVPLRTLTRELLEPECIAFSPDGTRAFVTLQENDAIAVVDVAAARVTAVWGAGTTRHAADVADDGKIAFESELFALREPDGIAVSPDGRWLVTADEGDTDPKAASTKAGLPAGGGRTVSVFDAATGKCLGDTENGIDAAAAAAGCYPDDRSDNKGAEPEMVVCFELDGHPYAAATLERADAVALVDLGDPSAPRVLAVVPLPGPGPHAPEGIACYADAKTGARYLYAANEASGRLGVYRVSAP